jgi:BirA family biotin operon repressor/biotin-[acetyl-CoA-carboxylase] ligase
MLADPNLVPVDTLKPAIKPWRLHYYARLGSTNDKATSLRKQKKLFAPALVMTSHQMHGRGRGYNTWHSRRGSFTGTFALPVDDARPPQQLPLIAGVAVRRAVVELVGEGHPIRLKWPNDLLHDDLKFAGLLCERVDNVDLVGIGINVNLRPAELPNELRHRVTSLRTIAGGPIPMTEVVKTLARHLRELTLLDPPSFSSIVAEFTRHHALSGRSVRVTTAGDNVSQSGTCEGLDSQGRLLLHTKSGVVKVLAGHVELA